MNVETKEITDVFHGYADVIVDTDLFARRHVHGLCVSFLKANGFCNETTLISAFRSWLRQKSYVKIIANDGAKECRKLDLLIDNMYLPLWAVRLYEPYHRISNAFKENQVPFFRDLCCSKDAHSRFHPSPPEKFSVSKRARFIHGYHCSLYDAYELYLLHVTSP